MSDKAVYVTGPQRVIFGAGSVSWVGEEVARLGCHRVLLVSTPGRCAQANVVADALGELCVARHPHARQHTPADVSDQAVQRVRDHAADCVVAVGGGSAIGLGKAVAARTGLDQVVLPTTYAGSEMTPVLGEVEDGEKHARRDPAILPETVIYDPALTMSMTPSMSSMSGINSIAHGVEAMYSPGRAE